MMIIKRGRTKNNNKHGVYIMLIQLPNDVESMGYKQTAPFKHEQVFHSASHNFSGTEKEFVARGLGYQYTQVDKYKRHIIGA